jgi:protein-tyrosine kinase
MSRIHEALKKAEQERASQQEKLGSDDVLFATPRVISEVAKDKASAVAATDKAGAVGVLTETMPQIPPPLTRPGKLTFEHVRDHCRKAEWHLDPNLNIFFNSDPATHGAEQFRTLRSRLYQLRGTEQLRTILVTSSIPGEGKTFVTNNLGHAIVRQPDHRALIIDADLRRPRLHVPLGAPSGPGLTDYLRNEADELAVIQNGGSGSLFFIAGGTEVANPSELLLNGRLKTLLERLTPLFDWVILDSPPCLPVADASVLADMCDSVLFVVRAGSTPSEVAQKACQELQGKKVVGVVLNAIEKGHLSGSYYYHHYGYGYGYGAGKK